MNNLIYKYFAYMCVKIPDGILGSGMYVCAILTGTLMAPLDVSVGIAPAILVTVWPLAEALFCDGRSNLCTHEYNVFVP